MSQENNIEQIKHLIFGENIKLYDQKFEKINAEIKKITDQLKEFQKTSKSDSEKLQNQYLDEIKNISDQLNSRIENLSQDIISRLDQIQLEKMNNKDFAELLIELAEKIKK